jgi:hypothetical protein
MAHFQCVKIQQQLVQIEAMACAVDIGDEAGLEPGFQPAGPVRTRSVAVVHGEQLVGVAGVDVESQPAQSGRRHHLPDRVSPTRRSTPSVRHARHHAPGGKWNLDAGGVV